MLFISVDLDGCAMEEFVHGAEQFDDVTMPALRYNGSNG